MLAEAVHNSGVKTYYPPDGKEYHEDCKCEKYDFMSADLAWKIEFHNSFCFDVFL